MEKVTNVDQYLIKHDKFNELLDILRSILLETELTETIKWSVPTYTINNKNVIGLGAFKHHVALWFFQGVFLKDQAKVLNNAQEGKTKSMRQWRFTNLDDLDVNLIQAYILEAIENQKKGLELKPEKKGKAVEIPIELKDAFKNHTALEHCFKGLTPGKQREYCEHISSAKRESTKMSRLEKIIPMILDNKGLYDKYKNC